MAELYEIKDIEERVLLLAVVTGSEADTEACLDELAELVKTAGGIVLGREGTSVGNRGHRRGLRR